ncbi:MAG: CPBP family intramembrane metalloprotease [Labilithrix sp.]|nr:CPBP family intramembrane metalloprotease [Labilithrix sp.]
MRNVAQLAGIVLAIGAGAHFAFQLTRAGQPSFLLCLGLPTVAIAVVAALRAHRDGALYRRGSFDEKGGNGWLNVRSGDFTRGFVASALLFGGAWVFTKVVAPAGSDRESWLARLYLQLGDPSTLRKNVAWVVAALIVMAVAEELVWRGLVISLLEEIIGSRRAWVWAAVLYAVAHVPTIWALSDPVAGKNPVLPVAALAAGLVWGFMARRFERLLPGIFSHVLFDWTVVMMFRLWGPSV